MTNFTTKILGVFLLLFNVLAFSQTNRFYYDLHYRKDSTQDYRHNYMILDVNRKDVKFYEKEFAEYDSINKLGKEFPSRFSTKTDQLIKRKINTNKNEWYRESFDYFVMKTNDEMSWEIVPETMIYQDYTLQKAKTVFGGRKWIAWFAKDVDIQEGPYKFRGLPGLIFMIEDQKKNFVYKLIKNVKIPKTFDTSSFLESHYGTKPISITLNQFNDYQEDIYTNPTRILMEKMKDSKGITVKDETVNSEDLMKKKEMLKQMIKNRFIYIEIDTAPKF